MDGSVGEGGGQILRTSVAFSAILGRPVEIVNIRAKRDNPGLRPQHVGAIQAVASLCDGTSENLKVGADWIRFAPGPVKSAALKLDVGSAGSITLILQAVIPAASLGRGRVELEITGGTDVKWSPTINYFQNVVLAAYRLVGVDCQLEVVRRGYYPKGGGVVRGWVKPAEDLKPVTLLSLTSAPASVVSVCSNLPKSVAERQLTAAVNYLFMKGVKCESKSVSMEDSISVGSTILVYSVGPTGPFLGADSLGERGKPAEQVGREAAQLFMRELGFGAPLDRHVADMLVSLLAFAEGESRFRVSSVTQHLTTNLYVASQFTGCKFKVSEESSGAALVSIGGGRLPK